MVRTKQSTRQLRIKTWKDFIDIMEDTDKSEGLNVPFVFGALVA